MTTYIITAHPEKDIWTMFHSAECYSRRQIQQICNNEIITWTSQDNSVQLILLPSMKGQKESRVIELIYNMKSKNIIEDNDNSLYLILHRNDFYEDSSKAPNLGLISGFKQDEILYLFNDKCYYYTSEGGDEMFKYLTKDPNNDYYFKDIKDFFTKLDPNNDNTIQ